ncbi:DUF4159 domain-containing protein [Marinibacterium profundimaris]|uniref:LytTR family transcriptional regulator n=1 Tax=Marinibacterium profundimaris TaxID=1679460 RepID=A0A225NNA5_9RHOB|nr:DUF4159 domain-containing protein [Marinibacterium profundimaris]OWU75915.1 LytTR family transcriptional regulator [Marinibacterium profundimaris]
MTVIAGIGFSAPWLLLALLALPVLWIILRAVPPAPIRRRFPGVALLLGLSDEDTVTDRTPWWLLLLRVLAVAAVIVGLAGPVLNPQRDAGGRGPLLILLDGTWAGATRWSEKQDLVAAQLAEAGRANRPVAVLRLTDPEAPSFQAADAWRSRIAGLTPAPYAPTQRQIDTMLTALDEAGTFDTHWISDGLDYDGRARVTEALQARGDLRVYQTGSAVMGLAPPVFDDGAIVLTARRSVAGPSRDVVILAQGRDPAGTARVLSTATATFEDGALEAETALSLPAELRARITRFEIQAQQSAGATTLTDDSLRRREVALISGREDREGLQLLSPLHYLHQALLPSAELLEGALLDLLPANPDVVVLADIATLSQAESEALAAWVEDGGMLLRFAGPRLAASDVSREDEDPLMPVRLRAGGRSVGGAMSWGEPKGLAPFAAESPFFGLSIPEDVTVNAQVMAQPDPTLADRVIASLADGTPLVTRKELGQGQVVLFHVTANAEWSTLPLSGLFVEMLERLAVSTATQAPSAMDLEGTTWEPVQVMDGYGALSEAGTRPGVDGPDLAEAPLGPELLPGIYESGDRRLARNVLTAETELMPATWPADVPVEGLGLGAERPLGGLLLTLALGLLAADILASLALSGRLRGQRAAAAALAMLALGLSLSMAHQGQAQVVADEDAALRATEELVLAHVITGDPQVDELAHAGLRGLGDTLRYRTSVEPGDPAGVNLETDELAFYPMLYWPVTADQPIPSAEAYARLNAYLRSGGLIVFDTRDADVAGFGASSPNGRRLQRLAAPLDIPPLEPIPHDHVLTRTFYLLQDFPGRYANRDVWVESAPPDAEQVEGMPFRNLNDGVTPVIIGGNDWAGAWAVDQSGRPVLPVGRGFAGERQRELANRFGVNLVMHVLTGNYKSDQVHVPALLDRLGQ